MDLFSSKSADPSEMVLPTFYPAARTLSTAHSIVLTVGSKISGIDIALSRRPLRRPLRLRPKIITKHFSIAGDSTRR